MILALETSTPVCSVVFQNKDGKLFEKRSETQSSHSENLFLFIDALMKEHSFTVSDLEAVLVSEGPGSYTGLRIAASGVKGLLFNRDIPLFGVNTLVSFAQGIAENADSQSRIHSIIDARRKHVYHQQFVYDKELKSEIGVKITPIKKFKKIVKSGDIIVGTGLDRIEQGVKEKVKVFDQKYITATSLMRLFQAGEKDHIKEVKPADFEPRYYTSNQTE